MVDITMALPEGTRAYLLAPIVRDRKGEYRKEFADLRKQGFQRVKVNGEFHDLETPPELDKKYRHDIDVVVDRIVVREGLETRLADSLRTALDLADGIAILETAPPTDEDGAGEEPRRITFSEKFACPVSGFTIPEIEPRLFSFNAPYGACPACDGLGVELFFDPRLVVPDEGLTPDARGDRALGQGAVALLPADDRGAGGALRVRQVEEAGATCRSRRRRCCSTARTARRSASATTRAGGSTRSRGRSRG